MNQKLFLTSLILGFTRCSVQHANHLQFTSAFPNSFAEAGATVEELKPHIVYGATTGFDNESEDVHSLTSLNVGLGVQHVSENFLTNEVAQVESMESGGDASGPGAGNALLQHYGRISQVRPAQLVRFAEEINSNLCDLPIRHGLCGGKIPTYFYNTKLGLCDCFLFGGCLAGGNNFHNLNQCMRVCNVSPDKQRQTNTCKKLFNQANDLHNDGLVPLSVFAVYGSDISSIPLEDESVEPREENGNDVSGEDDSEENKKDKDSVTTDDNGENLESDDHKHQAGESEESDSAKSSEKDNSGEESMYSDESDHSNESDESDSESDESGEWVHAYSSPSKLRPFGVTTVRRIPSASDEYRQTRGFSILGRVRPEISGGNIYRYLFDK